MIIKTNTLHNPYWYCSYILKCSYNQWTWYRAKNVQVICPSSVGGGIHMPALDKIHWNRPMLQCCTRHQSLSIPGHPSNHHHPDMKKHYNWRKPQPLVSNALQYNKHAEYTHGINDHGSKIVIWYFKDLDTKLLTTFCFLHCHNYLDSHSLLVHCMLRPIQIEQNVIIKTSGM